MRGRALAVIVLSVVCVTSLDVADAGARARGGGSRGSRTFTAPARPTGSPVTTSRPVEPSTVSAPRPAPPVASGGSWSLLPGMLVGGLIGTFFGGAGGGLGMINLLLFGV